MTDKIVADRYAQALIGMVTELGQIDRLQDETTRVANVIASDETLRKFLLSPRVMPSIKKELVQKAFASSISQELINLLMLLIDKHRENIIVNVLNRFDQLADDLRGVETGTVITAVPIHDEDFHMLEDKIQKFSKRRITLNREIDPSLIAGVVLWLGNHVIDGSIKCRLEMVRCNLLEIKPQVGK